MADGMGFDEVLAICLDALDGGQGVSELLRRYPEHEQELKPLLDAAVWFGGQAVALAPRPGFITASRARLMEQIAAPPVVTGNWLQRTWEQLFSGLGSGWRMALQAALVVMIVACLVIGSSGIAYASQNALPGDALYPVKLGLEQVELLVTLDPQEDLRLHMQFAQLRIAEMQRLLALGRYEDLAIASANYRYHVSQALALLRTLAAQYPTQAPALAQEVEVALTAQADTLGVLADIAPVEAQAEIEAAEQAAREGAQQAQEIGEGTETPLPTDATSEEEEQAASGTPTAPASATVVSFAVITPTPSRTPSPTPSPTPASTQTRTPTPTVTRTPTRTPLRTATATVRPSVTPTPKTGGTVAPTATRTPQPTPTRTGQPTPTRTTQPTPTRTGQPTPTRTTQPTPTRTGQPTPTRTTQPTPTATLPPATPTATNIPPTITIAPPPTRTPKPTHTPRPTDTPEPTPYPGPWIYPPP